MSLDTKEMQKIFNKVAKHLLTQRSKSTKCKKLEDGRNITDCVYRGNNGKRCAIGCLVPNKYYTKRMEGLSVCSLPIYFPDNFINSIRSVLRRKDYTLGAYDLEFFYFLQGVHDNNHPNSWKNKLTRLAEAYNLSPKVLEKF